MAFFSDDARLASSARYILGRLVSDRAERDGAFRRFSFFFFFCLVVFARLAGLAFFFFSFLSQCELQWRDSKSMVGWLVG